MGNETSKKSNVIVDDVISSLIEEVSAEIDAEYKDDEPFNSTIKRINSITELYKFHQKIGSGVSGSVFLAQSKQTYKHYALKQMTRSDKLNRESFIREIGILKQLSHPNIIYLNDAYISNENYYVTTEYCSGGTLMERIVKMKRFSERDCADFIKKILEALQYIHSKNIVHRDLKLSNIVFDNNDIKYSKLKLIDFGQSEQITNMDEMDKHIVGSLSFFPPEIVRRRRKRDLLAGDMWAVGILAYVLIEGAWPYKGKDIHSMMKCIAKRKLRWNDKIPISNACKRFIYALLNKDVNQRLNATQALNHPWIVNQATDDNLGDEYFNTLKRLSFQNKLQRVMVDAVLHSMDETDKKEILSHDGYKDDNQLINRIISVGTGTPTPTKSRRSRLNIPYKHTAEFSDKSLDEMDIDNILCEISAETAESFENAPMTPITPSPFVDNDDDDDDSEPLPDAFSPTMDDKISVERFVEILQSSSKKYDIAAIVANVADEGSQSVTFRRIASYHQPMDSLNL